MNQFERRLREAFPDQADDVLFAIRGDIDDVAAKFKPVEQWIRQCFRRPNNSSLRLLAVNCALDGFGVEAIFGDNESWPDMEYVNQGDTYTTTVYLDHIHFIWGVGSYGDWVEEMEAKGYHYD